MCGIFAIVYDAEGSAMDMKRVEDGFAEIRMRGPDRSTMTEARLTADSGYRVRLGFHRLAIMDTSSAGDQPMARPTVPGVTVVCNGEIYNWQQLAKLRQPAWPLTSSCDCEVLPYMYREYGFSGMLPHLEGYFGMVLHDANTGMVYAARDPQGVRPLFMGQFSGGIAFASELKALHGFCEHVAQVPPQCYIAYDGKSMRLTQWYSWPDPAVVSPRRSFGQELLPDYPAQVRAAFTRAVQIRVSADRPIAALLSGGLDSSLVAALVQREMTKTGRRLKTFSIGFEGATDLRYAKMVAEHIGSDHTEIVCTEADFLSVIPEVIRCIESYDTTSVRASVGNYLVARYVALNSDCKVLFNGDYSDEVFMSYQYASKCTDVDEFDAENRKLLSNIHYFDSLRSDRCISGWGLEARTPFADRRFIETVLLIPPRLKLHHDKIEKKLLRDAFAESGLLPEAVVWRRKEAFSDGVSKQEKSWAKVVQDHVDTKVTDTEFAAEKGRFQYCPPILKESYYYRVLFEQFYPGRGEVIPYFWLPNPKWCGEVVDPSARVLDCYKR